MKLSVLSSGVPHAVSRTLAFAGEEDEIDFVDLSGNADSDLLVSAGIRYWGPEDFDFSFAGLQRQLRLLQPDLIVCHFCSGPHFFGAIAYGQCPVAGIVMGSDVLFDQGDKTLPRLWPALIRMGLRNTAFLSAKSRHLETACRSLGVRAPIQVNYWGADTRTFSPSDMKVARRAAGLSPED